MALLQTTYLNLCFLLSKKQTTTYSLRNSDNVRNYHAHPNLFLISLFPSTIHAWNGLPKDVKAGSSVALFKHGIKLDIKEPPKFYNAGTCKGQFLYARLRLEFSSMNADLYRKNIVKSASCQCGQGPRTVSYTICPNFDSLWLG